MLKQKGKKYIVKRGPPTSTHATVSRPVSNTHDFLGWKHDLACASALLTPPPAPGVLLLRELKPSVYMRLLTQHLSLK